MNKSATLPERTKSPVTNGGEKNRANYFFILFLAALVVHMVLPLNWGDDSIFKSETVVGLADFLKGSSRLMTDTMTYVFCRWHFLWRICNPVIVTLLAKALCDLVPAENERLKKILFCTLPLYPTMVMVDAGFIATTVNYLWPLTFAVINILVLQKLLKGEKFKLIYLLAVPLELYALNMEMMSAVLCFVFLFGCGFMIYKKKFRIFPVLQLIISILGLLTAYIGNLSGDNSRMVREIGRYFPEFEALNILEKIELGFSSTFYCLTMKASFASAVFIAFTFFLSVAIFKSNHKTLFKILSVIPPAFSVVFSLISLTPLKDSDFILFLTGGMQHFKMTKAVYSFEIVPDIIFAVTAVLVLTLIAILLKERTDILKAYLILAVGLGTRLIMGFSPTVWASGYRTFCIMFIAICIVTVMIADRTFKKN